MNNSVEEVAKRLRFENLIWAVYIIISLFNIYGDELIIDSIKYNDKKKDKRAKTIFFIILIVTIIIYIYFLKRNYNDYKDSIDKETYGVRLFGSILVLVGTLCFLYFLIKTSNVDESLSNV